MQGANQRVAFVGQILGRSDIVGTHVCDEATHLICAAQQQLAGVRVQSDLPGTQRVQKGLDVMGEVDDIVQPEEACGSFDRMGAAKQRIQQLAIARAGLELQEQLLKLVEQFD